MSTVKFDFTGNESDIVTFTPTLDGAAYNCQTRWNIAGQRWYLNITDSSGNRILTTPMIASTDTTDINLIYGVFSTTTMVWRESTGKIEVTS